MIDLVMWSKHGPPNSVLARIDNIIPSKLIAQKLLVIDHSSDLTNNSYTKYGWQIVINEGKGISGAANTALKIVSTDRFASFEDDLLLSRVWWNEIPKQLKGKVAVVSGLRFTVSPKYLEALQIYGLKKFLPTTLDNTVWRTKVVRSVGGFPYSPTSSGVDTIMSQKIRDAGWNWVVDCSVRSVHLQNGLRGEMKRQYWYGLAHNTVKKHVFTSSKITVILRCLLSPLSSLAIVVATRTPEIVFAYPLLRLSHIKGMLKSR